MLQALYQIETEAKNTTCAYYLVSLLEKMGDYEEDHEDYARSYCLSDYHLAHDIGILETYKQNYPNTAMFSLPHASSLVLITSYLLLFL